MVVGFLTIVIMIVMLIMVVGFFAIMVMIVVIVVVMMVGAFLHPLHADIHHGVIAQGFQQVDGHQVFVFRFLHRILYPGIRGAANVHQQVGRGHLNKVLGGGLEVVQIHPAVLQEGQVHLLQPVPQDVAHPVVGGEGGAYNIQFLFFRSNAAHGQHKHQRQQGGKQFFHSIFLRFVKNQGKKSLNSSSSHGG